ncbi:MAG: glycoside hydrolase family 97 C-terminal domain-containing protein, partial [Bacteroides sp.]
RSGDTWYLGALTDENDREFEVTLDFIDGNKTITSWEDGVNVKMQARDFAKRTRQVNKGDKITLKLNGGGGYAAIIK